MKKKALIIFSVLLVFLIPNLGAAAVCPNITSLGMLNGGVDFQPLKVAIDDKGNTYVTDNRNHRVYVYDFKGKRKAAIEIHGPQGVAVDNNGKVFIGRSINNRGFHTGAVDVYDESLNFLYSLGTGWGEFKRPVSILVDGDRVYVADGNANLVKIYSASQGTFIGQFGGYGTGDGNLVRPVALDVIHGAGSALSIATAEMAAGQISVSYSYPVVAGGGTEPYTWSIAAGALPDGLTINSVTGEISGTPTVDGIFNFTVEVTDAVSTVDSAALSIEIYPSNDPGISDDFEDGVIGPQWVQKASGVGVLESGGLLNIDINEYSGTTYIVEGYRSATTVSGDFDFQVDFGDFSNVNDGTGQDHVYASIQFICDSTNTNRVEIVRQKVGTTTNRIFSLIRNNAANTTAGFNTNVSSGKLRVKRVGDTIYTYYDVGGGWVLLGTKSGAFTLDGNIEVYLLAKHADASVSFDNFIDHSNDINVPSPPPLPIPITGDMLYVADRALHWTDYNGQSGWGLGAGGHIFTSDGTFVKRFGTFGNEGALGDMVTPTGLSIDSGNRVIISDYTLGQLKIFDADGNSVCDVPLAALTPFPQGADVGKDGRLLVASEVGVYVLGLDDYVVLDVTPAKMTFDASPCGGSVPSENIYIANGGPGVLQWSISSDQPWATPSVTSGSINGQGSVTVPINVDSAGLAAGMHNATLTVDAQGAQETVDILLNVSQPAGFSVSPASLSFEVSGTTMPPAQTLTVADDGNGEVSWSAAVDSPWISVTPSAGSTSVTYIDNVSINPAGLSGLAAGTHTGTITVSSACAANGPETVQVNLNYIKGGTIQVTTNYDGAEFVLTGPATYTGTGLFYTVDSAPEGIYTITFADAQGFIKPDSYSLNVVNGTTTAFTGDYTDLRELNNIVVSMQGGLSMNTEEIRILDGTGAVLGTIPVAAGDPLADPTASKNGCETATGDLDGDGTDDIVVGLSGGTVTGYNADGTQIPGLSFTAYPSASDVVVTTADFDGDGKNEIVVGEGDKSGNESWVRIFSYNGGVVEDTGVYFAAYVDESKKNNNRVEKNGVILAAGDVNGDGVPELVTIDGATNKRTLQVKVWSIDTSAGTGAWTAVAAGGFLDGWTNSSADVAVGDINADGVDEIIVSVFDSSAATVSVIGFSAGGTKVLEFVAPVVGHIVEIAVGDIDFDGTAEIIIGDGSQDPNSSVVMVYNADGTYRGEFPAFDNPDVYGAQLSVGQLMGQ